MQEIKQCIDEAQEVTIQTQHCIFRALNLTEFLELEIPTREMILNPIIPQQGLAMLYAKRGIGKTYTAITIAIAVAYGLSIFNDRWQCQNPKKVLFVDGEMPASVLQERIASIIVAMRVERDDCASNLHIITPDLQEAYMSDLCSKDGQEALQPHIDKADVIILDNISSLFRSVRENEAESWAPVQEWLLYLRKSGKTVLLIHHSNKSGGQRGSSKKEDILDTVIELKHPEDYKPQDGARFEVHYGKSRGFYGDEAKPFEVILKADDPALWQTSDIKEGKKIDAKEVLALQEKGLSQRQIAAKLGTSAPTINRLLKGIDDNA